MQVEEVNRKIMANLHTSKKSITVPEEYFDESNEMDVDKHSVCQPRECFIEFNNSLVQFHEGMSLVILLYCDNRLFLIISFILRSHSNFEDY